jgi:hypothetical protein
MLNMSYVVIANNSKLLTKMNNDYRTGHTSALFLKHCYPNKF